jgi:hypothetical protein
VHQHAEPDHDAEGEEGDVDDRPVTAREAVQPLDRPVPFMGEDQRAEMRDGDIVIHLAGVHIRPAEQAERLGAGVEIPQPIRPITYARRTRVGCGSSPATMHADIEAAKRARRGATWAALIAVGVACLGFGGGIGFWLAGH